MLRKFFILSIFITLSGCANIDPQSMYYLNERISTLEKQDIKPQNNYVIIWIDGLNDNRIPIKIDQVGENFKGPRGEVYNNVPTKETLKKIYSF